MKITESPEFRAKLIKMMAEREFKERTGVHSTDLVYCLNKQALRRLKPKPIQDHELLLFSLGWAIQRWLTGKPEDEAEREVDGIKVTCDALEGGVPWEVKCTFQSSERPIIENVHWIRQCMMQCSATGSTHCYLSRFEIVGNWKSIFGKKVERALPKSKKPTLHCFHLEFTEDDLAAMGEWMRVRRDLFLGILKTGKLLPRVQASASGMRFECDYCGYKEECDAANGLPKI